MLYIRTYVRLSIRSNASLVRLSTEWCKAFYQPDIFFCSRTDTAYMIMNSVKVIRMQVKYKLLYQTINKHTDKRGPCSNVCVKYLRMQYFIRSCIFAPGLHYCVERTPIEGESRSAWPTFTFNRRSCCFPGGACCMWNTSYTRIWTERQAKVSY